MYITDLTDMTTACYNRRGEFVLLVLLYIIYDRNTFVRQN